MTLRKRLRQALRHGDLLIDAHNLCFRDPELKRLMHRDPEDARRALEIRLRHLTRAVLFYDGGPDGMRRQLTRLGLRCIYSGSDGSGDDEIVAFLQRNRHKRTAVVISDDCDLRRRCAALGARNCSCAEFLSWMANHSHKSGPDDHVYRNTELDSAELALWLKEFGVTDDPKQRDPNVD